MACFFSLSQGVCFSGVGEFVECLNMCVFLFWMFAMGGVGSLLSSDLRYTLAVFPCFTERMDSVRWVPCVIDYKFISGIITAISGVITLYFITCGGASCKMFCQHNSGYSGTRNTNS